MGVEREGVDHMYRERHGRCVCVGGGSGSSLGSLAATGGGGGQDSGGLLVKHTTRGRKGW